MVWVSKYDQAYCDLRVFGGAYLEIKLFLSSRFVNEHTYHQVMVNMNKKRRGGRLV
jgi:hypothetical protein